MSTRNALNALQPSTGAGDGRDLLINCPKCGTRGAKAVAYDEIEEMYAVIRHRTTWVKCLTCGRTLYSKMRADDLIGLSAADLERVVVARVSLISKLFAIMAILLCFVPFFGTGFGLLASAINYRHRGWLRWISLTGLALSLVPTTLFLIAPHRRTSAQPSHPALTRPSAPTPAAGAPQ